MINNLFLPKDHPDLPDHYEVKVEHYNGKVETLKIAKHTEIDKIFMFDKKGNLIGWETHPSPYYEFELTDNTYKRIPMANASFHFNKDWTRTMEIHEELDNKEKEQNEDA